MIDVSLRPQTPEDDAFLRRLLIATITEELAAWLWPEPVRDQLLDMQYRVRRQGVEGNYPGADRSIILADGAEAGWLVVARSAEELRVVEIAVLPDLRGKGIGAAALGAVLVESDRTGIPARLNVNIANRAARLYERLGFTRTGGNEVQHFMERMPAGPV
jgi:GNAT superfamily N-acetyltransferase